MSIPSVPYEDFSSSNQALVASGGPWSVNSDNSQCLSDSSAGCNGYCLACEVFPPDSLPSYHPVFNANISVNLANYGGATNLDFTWSYWPLYCGSNITAGTSIPVHSQVGDASFDDTFSSVDFYSFFQNGHQWDTASKLAHSASTSVVLGSNPTTGYIPLSISFTMTPTNHDEYLNYYMQGIAFQITTPQQSDITPSPSSSSSSPLSLSSSPSFSSGVISSSHPTSSSNTTSHPNSDIHTQYSSTLDQSSSSTFVVAIGTASAPSPFPSALPVGAIVGITAGAIVVFITLLLISLFLFLRRRGRGWRRGREKGLMADPDPFMEHQDKEVSHDYERESHVTISTSAAPWTVSHQPTLDGGERNTPDGSGVADSLGEQNTPGGIGTEGRNDRPTASGAPTVKAQSYRKRSGTLQGVNGSTTVLSVGTATTTTEEGDNERRGVHEEGSNGLRFPMMGISPNATGSAGGRGAGRPTSFTPPSSPLPPLIHHQPTSIKTPLLKPSILHTLTLTLTHEHQFTLNHKHQSKSKSNPQPPPSPRSSHASHARIET